MKLRDKIVIRNLLNKGDYEGIISEVNDLLNQEENSYLYYMKAQALFNCGKFNESLESIRQSFSYSDAGNELLLLAGRIYFKLNYFKKAEEFYLHSLKLRPDCTETMASYSFLLFITGSIDKAYIMLEKARDSEYFNIYTMIAEAKISLYSTGYKDDSYQLEKIITHSSGETFDIINSALILRLNKNRQESKRLIQQLLIQGKTDEKLLHTLLKLTSIPPYYRKVKQYRKPIYTLGGYLLMVIAAAALIFYQFGPYYSLIMIISAIAVSALLFIIFKMFTLFSS